MALDHRVEHLGRFIVACIGPQQVGQIGRRVLADRCGCEGLAGDLQRLLLVAVTLIAPGEFTAGCDELGDAAPGLQIGGARTLLIADVGHDVADQQPGLVAARIET